MVLTVKVHYSFLILTFLQKGLRRNAHFLGVSADYFKRQIMFIIYFKLYNLSNLIAFLSIFYLY